MSSPPRGLDPETLNSIIWRLRLRERITQRLTEGNPSTSYVTRMSAGAALHTLRDVLKMLGETVEEPCPCALCENSRFVLEGSARPSEIRWEDYDTGI